uniref:CSON003675 protein n=1 Tax=Culicoides sonorensis TaxID=179676 RepID=A0A336K205_CULSO
MARIVDTILICLFYLHTFWDVFKKSLILITEHCLCSQAGNVLLHQSIMAFMVWKVLMHKYSRSKYCGLVRQSVPVTKISGLQQIKDIPHSEYISKKKKIYLHLLLSGIDEIIYNSISVKLFHLDDMYHFVKTFYFIFILLQSFVWAYYGNFEESEYLECMKIIAEHLPHSFKKLNDWPTTVCSGIIHPNNMNDNDQSFAVFYNDCINEGIQLTKQEFIFFGKTEEKCFYQSVILRIHSNSRYDFLTPDMKLSLPTKKSYMISNELNFV